MKKLSYLLSVVLTILILILFNSISQAQTSFNISNKTTGDTLLTIDNDGRIGIGTTMPQFSIDVKSSTVDDFSSLRLGNLDGSRYLFIHSGNSLYNPIIRWHEGAALRFSTWTETFTEHMRIAANGYVGIGTNDPSTRLEVADTIFSSAGGFKFPDSTVQTTAAGAGLANTLDQAYDQGGAGAGRVITADAGGVGIAGSGGIWVSGHISGLGGQTLSGIGEEGGQLNLLDGDGEGSWMMDNFGATDNEALRFFRGSALNALVINSTGNVGIGTGGPSADLHVDGLDGVLFGGTYGSGSIPAEGEGSRMMWYPAKAAFRSGRLWSTYSTFWDIDSIGDYSFAAGFNTRASGRNSTSIGNYTNASGDYSLATGNSTTASGYNSTALGNGSIASGDMSTALGSFTRAIGNVSVSMGYDTEANGVYSVAMGDGTISSSWASVAMGNGTVASGSRSTAMGLETIASGDYSTAMGYYTTASGSQSTTMGLSTEASGDHSTAMGVSSEASGLTSTAMGRNTIASGDYSTAMGSYTTASGNQSTTMGSHVTVQEEGSFAIGDNSTAVSPTFTTAHRFYARFANGYRLYTNSALTSGAEMLAGANSWSTISDSTKKENFKSVDGEDFLNKISSFNLTSWNYKGQDPSKFRHYGPMAQDFYAAFGNDGIGTIGNDTTLASADFDGINFIAIQALEKRTTKLKSENELLINEVLSLKNENNELKDKLASIESNMQKVTAFINAYQGQLKTTQANNVLTSTR